MNWAIAGIRTTGLILCLLPALGQVPSFEVATVKPSTTESGPMAIRRTTGQFLTARTPVSFLIRWAYDLDEDRLIGSNRHLDSNEFDIVAKIPEGELPAAQLKLRMQSLLAERFELRIHHETRTLQTYVLLADAQGLKVRFVDAATGQEPFRMTERGRLMGTAVTADMLAKVLSSQIGGSVVDETGVTRRFDFVLEWAPDLDTTSPQQPSRPSIFSAVREQLGMRLDSRRAPVDVVVIDSVLEQPTEN